MSDDPSVARRAVIRTRFIIAIGMCIVGVVWFCQGMGWLKGSFMTGDNTYTFLGAALAVVGGGLIAWHIRSGRS